MFTKASSKTLPEFWVFVCSRHREKLRNGTVNSNLVGHWFQYFQNGSTVEHLPVADSSVGEAFSGLKSYVDHGVFADNVAAGGDRVFPSKTYAARIQEQAEFTPEISRSIAYTVAVFKLLRECAKLNFMLSHKDNWKTLFSV